jgi:hypothetical protein
MRSKFLKLIFLFTAIWQAKAAVVFVEDFNRSTTNQTIVSNNWVEGNSGLGDAAITNNMLVLKNGATSGRTWIAQSVANFASPYTAQLKQNLDVVTWNLNMQSTRGGFNQLTGFDLSQYGIAYVLATTSSDFVTGAGTGYAVVWGQPGGITPLRLVQLNSVLTNNTAASFTDLIVSTNAPFDNVTTTRLSVRVSYDPSTDVWQLFARNDGAAFADPGAGTYTLLGTATNSTYTAQAMGFMGPLWNYNTTLNQYSWFDNFSVEVQLRPPSISAQPQTQLETIGSTATVSVTAAGTKPLSYQWYFNGVLMAGKTGAAVSIPNFQAANEGTYNVVITNPYGTVTSSDATLLINRDFGDAPAPYPSLRASNGARHLFVPGYFLGGSVDGEADGQIDANATGDDLDGNNDDDGVFLTSALVAGQTATLQVVASTNGFLNGWVDFNQNGSWADGGEQVFINQVVVPG